MGALLPVHLNDAQIEAFGREIGAIYDEVKADLGERDARYIRRLITIQRSMDLGGRIVIFAALAFVPAWGHGLAAWPVFLAIVSLGTLALGTAKVLENMEIAHNVMHGQWDWMRDPEIQSRTWEWDNACPSDQWRHSHNLVHHMWTNVVGKDHDIGYDVLRMAPAQRWSPFHLLQPLASVFMAALFEWFVAFHDLDIHRRENGQDVERAWRLWRGIRHKVFRQALKDFVLYPALAGPFFLYVCGANLAANVIRNLWTWVVIFCGHFPAGVHVFSPEQIEGETRGRWYVRQLLGSCNITGGRLFDVLSGNLSHHIEHHLFPDMPSNRYPEVAPRVRAICARYGLPYNSGTLGHQLATTAMKIFRLALPSTGPADATALEMT